MVFRLLWRSVGGVGTGLSAVVCRRRSGLDISRSHCRILPGVSDSQRQDSSTPDRDVGEVDCGGCGEGLDCGEELDNVCGGLCEVDADSYPKGAVSVEDEPCVICDPDVAEDAFTDRADFDEYAECGDECIEIETSPEHSGDCFDPCADIYVCLDGQCQDCPDGETACDGFCRDTDVAHCSECDLACPDDVEGASPTCEDGECGYVCDDLDHELCESDGLCADLSDDADLCGGCGQPCPDDESCFDGDCKESEDDGHCPDGVCNQLSNNLRVLQR